FAVENQKHQGCDVGDEYGDDCLDPPVREQALPPGGRQREAQEEYRDRDAEEHVDWDDGGRPDPAHPRPVSEVSQLPHRSGLRVEEGAERDPFFENAVCGAEEKDCPPALVPPDHGLADEEDSWAVETEVRYELEDELS